MQNFIKTKILVAFLIFFSLVLVGLFLLNTINPKSSKTPLSKPSPSVTKIDDLPPIDLNPSIKPGYTKPWAKEGEKILFRISNAKTLCQPNNITVEKGEFVKLIFEGGGGFEEEQLTKLKKLPSYFEFKSTIEYVYEFLATNPGSFKYYCKSDIHQETSSSDNDSKNFGTLNIK